jgi:SAM-dependent methyltransferase
MSAAEPDIQAFWETHPCGDSLVGGLRSSFESDYRAFFRSYDSYRYGKEPHILAALDRFDFKDKKVLEIGLGQGSDSQQLIARGARWSGLDLSPEAVARVRARMEIGKLPFEDIKQGSVLAAPFDGESFDIVFSHGVLHHVPDILAAQREIHRILKPHGQLIVMVYAKHSLNYHVAIRIVRRLGLALLYVSGVRPGGIYDRHLDNARRAGLFRYLRMKNFIHQSTDGPGNPYSKVYTVRSLGRDFPDFSITDSFKCWLHHPPIPPTGLPLGHWLGWHLWAVMEKR